MLVSGVEAEDREARVASPPNSDQLELELAGPGRAWLEPWLGKSPRSLTDGFKRFRLEPLPAGGPIGSDLARQISDEEQEELAGQLLLPFAKEGYDG